MKKIAFYILITCVLIPFSANAQAANDTYTLLAPLPCIEGAGADCAGGNMQSSISLNGYIGYVFKFSIALAIFLAVIMIIWGGFQYITSEVPFIKSNGKQTIQNAALGLIGVLVSYLILRTIDPRLVAVNTQLEPIKIDVTDVKSFSNSLTEDLGKLSKETQVQISAETQKISDYEKERLAILEKHRLGQLDEDETSIELAKLNQRINASVVQVEKLKAENIAMVDFAKVTEGIYNPDKENLTDAIKNNTATIEAVNTRYDQAINNIKGSDPKTAETLTKQKTFFNAQIEEDKKLVVMVNDKLLGKTLYVQNSPNGTGDFYNLQLMAKREEYQIALNNQEKAAASGFSSSIYASVFQSRIDRINSVLPKK